MFMNCLLRDRRHSAETGWPISSAWNTYVRFNNLMR